MFDLESIVYTRIKNEVPSWLKTKYKDIDFVTSDTNWSGTRFPCVYIHLMSSPEIGMDTEADNINGVNAYFNIEVIDNQSQKRANEVMKEVCKVMKSMRFIVNAMPFVNNKDPFTAKKDATFRLVSRARRVIGSDDIL